MPLSMYEASVTTFQKHLRALDAILDKAVAYVEAKKLDPDALLLDRIYPDMFPLRRQVQAACDFAKLCSARLGGVTPPVHDDSEKTFTDLKRRIAETEAILATVTPEAVNASEDKPFTIKAGAREFNLTGSEYLIGLALPNFFFHCTTAYAILRHNGLEIGKLDFMGRAAA